MVYPSELEFLYDYQMVYQWLTRVIGAGVGGRGTLVSGTWNFLEIKNFEHENEKK